MMFRRSWIGLLLFTALALPPTSSSTPVGKSAVHVPILVFHSVTPHSAGQTSEQREYDVAPESFEQEMSYLHDHAIAVVPLSALVAELTSGPHVSEPAVVLTFDDGWDTQYRHAVPTLLRFGYTATFFVFTSAIEHREFMSWDELRDLQRAGMTIGSHSRTHPELIKLAPPALDDEVAGSRQVLRRELGSTIDYFAYPFGEHSAAVEHAVRAAGYRAARECPGGAWNTPKDRWALHAVIVTDDLAQFIKDIQPPR